MGKLLIQGEVGYFRVLASLIVKFQQVVVHSVENWEAEIASNSDSQETEWTITIMLD